MIIGYKKDNRRNVTPLATCRRTTDNPTAAPKVTGTVTQHIAAGILHCQQEHFIFKEFLVIYQPYNSRFPIPKETEYQQVIRNGAK